MLAVFVYFMLKFYILGLDTQTSWCGSSGTSCFQLKYDQKHIWKKSRYNLTARVALCRYVDMKRIKLSMSELKLVTFNLWQVDVLPSEPDQRSFVKKKRWRIIHFH